MDFFLLLLPPTAFTSLLNFFEEFFSPSVLLCSSYTSHKLPRDHVIEGKKIKTTHCTYKPCGWGGGGEGGGGPGHRNNNFFYNENVVTSQTTLMFMVMIFIQALMVFYKLLLRFILPEKYYITRSMGCILQSNNYYLLIFFSCLIHGCQFIFSVANTPATLRFVISVRATPRQASSRLGCGCFF